MCPPLNLAPECCVHGPQFVSVASATISSVRSDLVSGSPENSLTLLRTLDKRLPVPLETRVRVRFLGHQRGEASLRQFAFKFLSHPNIFIDVLDLILGAVFDFFGVAEKLSRWMERQIACRLAASVEVLVKPF